MDDEPSLFQMALIWAVSSVVAMARRALGVET